MANITMKNSIKMDFILISFDKSLLIFQVVILNKILSKSILSAICPKALSKVVHVIKF